MSAVMTRAYTPSMQFLDENGKPLVFGFLCTYRAGQNTPLATYNDNGQLNPVRIPLNELGSPENGVQLDVSKEYKFVLLRADGTTVWTKDHVKAAGVGDITIDGITDIEPGTDNVHVTTSSDGKTATISVDDSVFLGDENTLWQEWREAFLANKTLILRRHFQLDSRWANVDYRMSEYIDTRTRECFIFTGVSDGVEYTATLDYPASWGYTSRELASAYDLQVEAQTRASADADLQAQIDDVQIDVDESLSTTSTNPVENRAVTGAVNSKQDQIPQEQLDEMTDQEIDDLIDSLN